MEETKHDVFTPYEKLFIDSINVEDQNDDMDLYEKVHYINRKFISEWWYGWNKETYKDEVVAFANYLGALSSCMDVAHFPHVMTEHKEKYGIKFKYTKDYYIGIATAFVTLKNNF